MSEQHYPEADPDPRCTCPSLSEASFTYQVGDGTLVELPMRDAACPIHGEAVADVTPRPLPPALDA